MCCDQYRHEVRQVGDPRHRRIMIINVHDHLTCAACLDDCLHLCHGFGRRTPVWCDDPGPVDEQSRMGSHRTGVMRAGHWV